ncbi:hypothetical protein GE253_24830 [Niveispirillum sp. SYP-B3756]|uniref:hypothetical protein n=1 Tax=Niveispirillum sp. SYP-B3756 TaxID=2662178 RepID=UPI001290F19C|nr:hypothetical protein [Niveispirillum sp. SYP-B3756]MQP68547.1 hypothetical protein [Niveispirillum sp. SYP-B3756]
MLRQKLVLVAMLCVVPVEQPKAEDKLSQSYDLCSITSCCKATVGAVDSCAYYWTFKKTNPGDIARVVNTDPRACTLAVTSNLDRLAKELRSAFEISVPTDALGQALSALRVPEDRALFAAGLELTTITDNQEIVPAIEATIVRYLQFRKDWLEYLQVSATTARWAGAGRAAEELSAIADGLIVHLSTGGSWPKLREFAPSVWKLMICAHNHPNQIASLEQRLAGGSTDSARHFAFLDKLDTLMAPFAVKPTSVALERIASPFFTEPLAEVTRRKRESLFASSATYKLKVEVDRLSMDIARYTEERIMQQQARKTTLDANLAAERAAASMLSDPYTKLQKEVSIVESVKQQAKATLATAIATLSQAKTMREVAETTLLAARARRDTLSNAVEKAYEASDLAADSLDAAVAALEGVRLNCAGAAYDDCTSSAAKMAYDKAVYQANQAVTAARTAFASTRHSAAKATADVVEAEKLVSEQQALALSKAEAVANALDARDVAEVAVTDATTRLEILKQKAAPLEAAMARFLAAIDIMEQCVALTDESEAKKVCV